MKGRPPIPPETRRRVIQLTRDGATNAEIQKVTGLSDRTIRRIRQGIASPSEMGLPSNDASGRRLHTVAAIANYDGDIPGARWQVGQLEPDVLDSLRDFELFCDRYGGRKLFDHQREWIKHILGNRFAMVMSAPRHGKTELVSVLLPVWLLCGGGYDDDYYDEPTNPLRNHQIMLVSQSEDQAAKNFRAISSLLTLDQAILRDFGRFKGASLPWIESKGALIVEGREREKLSGDYSLIVIGNKSHPLGRGASWIILDDFADTQNCKTEEQAESLITRFKTDIFSRLNPGGRISVVGARIPLPNDPYSAIEDLPADPSLSEEDERTGDYKRLFATVNQPAVLDWDTKQVLSPKHWPWSELMAKRALQGPVIFEVNFQQKRFSGAFGLIRRDWIYGAGEHPGCLDHNRARGEAPKEYRHLNERIPHLRVMSVDPSPTKFTGALLFDLPDYGDRLYHPHLIDMERAKLPTNDLIALMWSWWKTYRFQVLVLEQNISHFLTQTDMFQSFLRQTGVTYIPHKTSSENKGHDLYGRQTLAGDIADGRVRIPYADAPTKYHFSLLIKELLEEITTDDLFMALWFPKWHLAGLLAKARQHSSGGGWPGWGVGAHVPPPPRMMTDAPAVA